MKPASSATSSIEACWSPRRANTLAADVIRQERVCACFSLRVRRRGIRRRPSPARRTPGAGECRDSSTTAAPRPGVSVMARRANALGLAAVRAAARPRARSPSARPSSRTGRSWPEAAAHAAAEGDPRVGARRLLEEALGAEALRLGVDVGAAVNEIDAGRDRTPRPAAGCPPISIGLGERGGPRRQHGPQPQRLLDDGVEVLVLAAQSTSSRSRCERVGMAQQALERPRERRWRWSRGRRPAASSARRAAPRRSSGGRPRGGPAGAARECRRARRGRRRPRRRRDLVDQHLVDRRRARAG